MIVDGVKNTLATAKGSFEIASASFLRFRQHQIIRSHYIRLLVAISLTTFIGFAYHVFSGTTPIPVEKDYWLWANTGNRQSTLRQRLAESVPYFPNERWSRNIVQSWRSSVIETPIYQSWENHKRDFNHIFFVDPEQDRCVRNLTRNNLHDVEFAYFQLLNKAIVRADLFRYFSIWAFGGIWADVDTWLRRPFDEWISMASPSVKSANIAKLERKVGMIVGIEYEHSQTLVQYVFAAKRGHPVLLELVADIVEKAPEIALSIDKKTFKSGQVLHTTGPIRFTEVVRQWVQKRWNASFDASKEWKELRSPTLFGDILVLPQWGFGGNQPYRPDHHDDKPGAHDDRTCVAHEYHNSWSSINDD